MTPGAKDGKKTIRVVIAEDQGMVLGALAKLLEFESDISVVAKARDGNEALDAVIAQKPDVFITDIEMPHMGKGVAPRWEGPHFEDVLVVAARRNEIRTALEVFGLLAKSSEYISDLLRVFRKIGQKRFGVTV